ncbi:protein FAR1-RELATED SEQUENCE 5-like [Salvia miltiorrhiza]|uniref:protein FAR1-RELATED SEQUENCE 5-like n=1 Tax=Salvia miltiorrhiza TaxID=226208 RepID=UPI0025AC48D5|nr:protein FAR1-RELATED SEQUENCE 5-like [Salvia miltiorrhiza]
MAKVKLQITTGGRYYIRFFMEGHTHLMVPGPTRHLMPSNREVGKIPQMLIVSGIKANIGLMRTFRMYREIVGSYEEVGCTSNDFKNYVRDLKVNLKDSDAHMLLEAFFNKQELGLGFRYFHDIDEQQKMRRLIWIDELAVKNYKLFGEALSFDATYCTNRYKLIFTAFTGIDNYGKCISFGAVLISREDMDSYSWFCMWHTNIKVTEKLPLRLRDDSNFRSKYDKIVWSDHDDPEVFEENWKDMIEEYDLASNRWLSDMYEDRMYWIPAYFIDTLCCYILTIASVVDAQRHNYHKLTLADKTRSPRIHTKLKLEEHAAAVYTNSVFKEVQEEIQASLIGCEFRKIYMDGDDKIYEVEDNLDGEFIVRHIHDEDYLVCNCKLFIRKGTICKHIFLVLKNMKFDKIPQKYIVKRWCKYSVIYPGEDQFVQPNMSSEFPPSGDFRFLKVVGEIIGFLQERRFSQFYGSAPIESPTVLPPDVAKTKGSGAGGRRKSDKEKAFLLADRPLRLCRKCNTKGHHDSRNCPTKDACS